MDNINNDYRVSVIEALILSSPEPLPAKKIADVVEDMTPSEVPKVVDILNDKYKQSDIAFRIRQISGGFQCYITEEFAPFVEELHTRRRNTRLSRPALETLSIIAYRQPVTKIDVEMIRGVASDSAIHTLLQRKLITMAGRAQTIGRPLLYKTTDEFLKYFNLNSLNDMPQMTEIEELIASENDNDAQQNLPLGPFSNKNGNDGKQPHDGASDENPTAENTTEEEIDNDQKDKNDIEENKSEVNDNEIESVIDSNLTVFMASGDSPPEETEIVDESLTENSEPTYTDAPDLHSETTDEDKNNQQPDALSAEEPEPDLAEINEE